MDWARIQRSPFPLGAVLAASWRVFLGRLWAILGITLLVYVPYEFLSLLLSPQGDSWQDIRRSIQIESVLSILVGILATLATYLLVEGEVTGSHVSLWRAVKHALRRWRSGVATEVLWGLVIVAGLLLLIVPGVILAGNYVFALCAVSLRDSSLREALSYSKSLVKGRWWSVVGVLFIVALITFVVTVIAGLAADLVRGHYLIDVVEGLVSDVAVSFLTVATGVYFLALDRREPEAQPAALAGTGTEAGTGLVELTPSPPDNRP